MQVRHFSCQKFALCCSPVLPLKMILPYVKLMHISQTTWYFSSLNFLLIFINDVGEILVIPKLWGNKYSKCSIFNCIYMYIFLAIMFLLLFGLLFNKYSFYYEVVMERQRVDFIVRYVIYWMALTGTTRSTCTTLYDSSKSGNPRSSNQR